MWLWCCSCKTKVPARLTRGSETYPNISELKSRPYWICDTCKNFVGCHHRSDRPTRPLGTIPTVALRKARATVHAQLDPIWRDGKISRSRAYRDMAKLMGTKEFHIGRLSTLEDTNKALCATQKLAQMVKDGSHKA